MSLHGAPGRLGSSLPFHAAAVAVAFSAISDDLLRTANEEMAFGAHFRLARHDDGHLEQRLLHASARPTRLQRKHVPLAYEISSPVPQGLPRVYACRSTADRAS